MGPGNRLLTVDTVQGDTPAQIAAKLASKHEADRPASPFKWVSVAPDGVAVEIEDTFPGDVFLRTTDTGIQTVSSATNLRAHSSKADGKVTLTWTQPDPAPDVLIICRQFDSMAFVPGTTTSYEDTGLDHRDGFRLSYILLGADEDADGKLTMFSDIAEVVSDNPQSMADDTFRITTTQDYMLAGVKDKPSAGARLYKNGGTNPVTWSLESGALPDGLALTTGYSSLEDLDALISGTPTATGTWDFTLKVTDATGATATKSYSIPVVELPVPQYPGED